MSIHRMVAVAGDLAEVTRMEIQAVKDRRQDQTLRRLVVIGNLMAEKLREYAAEIEKTSEPDTLTIEAEFAEMWDRTLDQFRNSRQAGR